MNIIVPIIIATLFMGLAVKRMTLIHWLLLSAWIAGVIGVYYVKN
jgi:hypothetical protein